VLSGTNDLMRFRAPMPDAIYFEVCSMCLFQDKFSLISRLRDSAQSTRLMGVSLIAKVGDESNVLILWLDPININSININFICGEPLTHHQHSQDLTVVQVPIDIYYFIITLSRPVIMVASRRALPVEWRLRKPD
jgi:hypothetical protein